MVEWTLRENGDPVQEARRGGREEGQERGGIKIRAIMNCSRRRGRSNEYVIDNTPARSLGLCCALDESDGFQGSKRRLL